MYRLHKTGVTVCKMCWITTDPLKTTTKGNKRKRKDEPESKNTKLCAVFLKDVFSSPSSKGDAVPKVEQEDVIYISSDESWKEEKLPGNRARRSLRRKWGEKSTKSDQEFDRRSKQGVKRPLKVEEAQKEDKKSKKLKSMKNMDVNLTSDRRRATRSHNSDSEIVIAAAMKLRNNSVVGESRGLDKSEKIHPGDKLGKRKVDKKKLAKERKEEEEEKPGTEDLSSADDDGVGRKLRKVRNKVSLALKSESTTDDDSSPQLDESRKSVRRRKSSVIVSKPHSQSPAVEKKSKSRVADKSPSTNETKINQKRSKTVMMISFPFKLKNPYECKVCGTVYRNKIVGMKHELTHFKQIEIKIEKLNMNHHFQTVNESSPLREISQEPDRDEGSLNLSQTNEKPTESEPEDSTDKGKDDCNQSEDKTLAEIENSVPNTNGLELLQEDDARTSDVEDTKESDAVEATGQPTPEESTVATNVSKDDTSEKIASEPSLENEESPNPKEDAVSKDIATEKEAEADLPAEINTEKDDNQSGDKESSEVVEEDAIKESIEEPDGTEKRVDVIEEKNVKEEVSQAVFSNTQRNETERRDSGEEMESDTDIRIVDTGSSADEGSDQSEKKEDEGDVSTWKGDVEDVKVADGEPADAEKSKSVSDDELESMTAFQKEPVLEDRSADADPENGEEEKENEDKVEIPLNDRVAESQDKTVEVNGDDVSTTSAVSEILQEVIDLASAEVQKRAEVEETAAETLEDISNEIKKSALENLEKIEPKTNKVKGCDDGETDMTLNDLYE